MISRQKWSELPDIYIRLEKDELGYPPKEWEALKGLEIDKDMYQIKSVPFYAKNVTWDDEISAATSPEGYYPVLSAVRKRSGYSTMRLMISDREDRSELIHHFTSLGVMIEFSGRLVALAIPRAVFESVSSYVCDEKDKGRWDAEDGFLIVEED